MQLSWISSSNWSWWRKMCFFLTNKKSSILNFSWGNNGGVAMVTLAGSLGEIRMTSTKIPPERTHTNSVNVWSIAISGEGYCPVTPCQHESSEWKKVWIWILNCTRCRQNADYMLTLSKRAITSGLKNGGKLFRRCVCVYVLQTEPIANGVILSCTHLEQGGSVQGWTYTFCK